MSQFAPASEKEQLILTHLVGDALTKSHKTNSLKAATILCHVCQTSSSCRGLPLQEVTTVLYGDVVTV